MKCTYDGGGNEPKNKSRRLAVRTMAEPSKHSKSPVSVKGGRRHRRYRPLADAHGSILRKPERGEGTVSERAVTGGRRRGDRRSEPRTPCHDESGQPRGGRSRSGTENGLDRSSVARCGRARGVPHGNRRARERPRLRAPAASAQNRSP